MPAKSLSLRLWMGTSLYSAILVTGVFWLASQALAVWWLLPIVCAAGLSLYLWIRCLLAPIRHINRAVADGISGLQDDDFSVSIHNQAYRESSDLVQAYNQLTDKLRQERLNISQRELLLDKVIQSAPMALVLTNGKQVVYSNYASRELFKRNGPIDGESFSDLCTGLSQELANVTEQQQQSLVSYTEQDLSLVYQFQCETFYLHGKTHYLYLYQNLSQAMSRKENELWKRLIRLISHELNNSLAPIQSLANSAKSILNTPEHLSMLEDIMDTIGDRSKHLQSFIQQYIEYAKLPEPNLGPVDLNGFYQQLTTLTEVHSEFDCSHQSAVFDPAQIEQVMLNLIKNAKESGSEASEVGFEIKQVGQKLSFSVYDRGSGMTDTQLTQALLPFYTTKPKGTGIGLTLCNEIVSAHNGHLRLYNRDHGGLCVSFTLALT